MTDLQDRIFEKVDATGDCWLWTASTWEGYGQIRIDGRTRRVHRVVYELLCGPLPRGMVLDHLCRVRHCCNPDHLEPVTDAENIRRGQVGSRNRAKKFCRNGHEYSKENTYVNPKGHRACRICKRQSGIISKPK